MPELLAPLDQATRLQRATAHDMGSSLSQNATVQEVKAAVEALGSAYVKYGTAVADNGINGAMLRDITGEEIGDLGVTSLHKRRMLSEIEIFKANLPPAAGEPAGARSAAHI